MTTKPAAAPYRMMPATFPPRRLSPSFGRRACYEEDCLPMSLDQRALRDALGCFPTGVAVVTTAAPPVAMGITVNSFTSVSLDPPLVLWCLNRRSDRFETFFNATAYTISILGSAHQSVSSKLAKPGSHNLEGIELITTQLGPPALADALAIFECASEASYDGGDHVILVGRVLRFARREAGAPLVFFQGRYGALAHLEQN
ncbi:MAG TPA: flavin reductase family protein [Rhizomicrobium sp.]|nr:flavin reductase family protein [Rhizomicrobium sp.]